MDSNMSLSDVLHGNWALHEDDVEVAAEEVHPVVAENGEDVVEDGEIVETNYEEEGNERESQEKFEDLDKTMNNRESGQDPPSSSINSSEPKVLISPPYFNVSKTQTSTSQQVLYCPGYAHGYSESSTYHQPFVSMVRQKKTSALTSALQRPVQKFPITPIPIAYVSGYPFGYGNSNFLRTDIKNIIMINDSEQQHPTDEISSKGYIRDVNGSMSVLKKEPSATSFPSSECGQTIPSHYAPNHSNHCFDLPVDVLEEIVDDNSDKHNRVQDSRECQENETTSLQRDAELLDGGIGRHENEKKLVESFDTGEVGEKTSDKNEEIVDVDEEDNDDAAPTTTVGDKDEVDSASLSTDTKPQRSQLETLLMQPVRKPVYQEYQPPFVVAFSAIGNQPQSSSQHLPKTMQFYQPPAQQHLARSTPPPAFAQPYGMGMRPHEEETRQIMNLDSQQTHNSSPNSSWNQPYGQMTNLNAYQPRGPNLYAPPVPQSMVHQNGPPGVVPTSNPYYPTPGPPPHHHIQPQAPMMAPGMHGQQQQQPYYNTQSPLTGTPPSMSYGNPQIPAPPPTTNGTAPIFNFSKPRNSNESSSVNGGGHRRKKHNDLSSPRYNNNSNEDVDASIFPDMADFPLLDVVQSKAKKDAGRKPCRPHLCEQSRMLISRVCHFHREFVKRLPSRHPLANSPFSKPDQWTSQIMGISLATVRKCIDMAVDEEVFTRCTDKNLVNLTPSERAEREELLSKLSTVFEDEKSLGAGTAGMTIAEYSPRRSYSNTLMRQSTDDKSSNSSFTANGVEYGSSETTLLNLDDHSNGSKDYGTTPTPTTELSNGGQIFEEIGAMVGNEPEEKTTTILETPKRGRPRKIPGVTTSKSSKRKESNEDSEMSEDKDDHEKKTEDEDETNDEAEKKMEELQQAVLTEREDDAASSEGTNRSETSTPEPTADTTTVAKKTRAAARRKNTRTVDEEYSTSAKKKRGSVTSATAGVTHLDDENSDHKMVTRARSRQP